MRTFKNFPEIDKCPICKTNENKECVLIGIDGTEDGGNIQAQPTHLDCIELRIAKDKSDTLIYQVIGSQEE